MTRMTMEENVSILKEQLDAADAIVIGAGAGLSTAAGYQYEGERFDRYFSDFEEKYHFHNMYYGGFYPYSSMEEYWGFWCRYIWINRYAPIPSGLYERLFSLIKDKDYFVLTTNVDHCFQRSGFDKKRLFYTQGDYGLFQSSSPNRVTRRRTYDNYEAVREMVLSEGWKIQENGVLSSPESGAVHMTIPSNLVPVCPEDGQLMTMNLRSDDTFVQDDGWYAAAQRYRDFLQRREGKRVLYLKLGVGDNTPIIIKYPFWQYTKENPKAFYACINKGEAYCPKVIADRAVCIDGDIEEVLRKLMV